METTTIKIRKDTKSGLDRLREYRNESYDELIKKMLYVTETSKTHPELSREVVDAIEKARERIRKGRFVTEEEARKRLGF